MLWREGPASATIRGGQDAADRAFTSFDVTGYADTRNEVWPRSRRGASQLSPYIRHGLLPLPRVWNEVAGPAGDVRKFRDELLWQEYARHLYARVGGALATSLRFSVPTTTEAARGVPTPWDTDALCVASARDELHSGGWIPNQARMWLASHWTVRSGWGWRDGEDKFFRNLLDGSRAANRVGWQWTSGALTGKPYGFSQWQVRKRAPGLCDECTLKDACPIAEWPPESEPRPRSVVDPRLRRDPDVARTAGPAEPVLQGEPELVWLTAESLGTQDPALVAHPETPAVFVFDLPLLTRLRLSGGRLTFLVECLADLATKRDVHLLIGEPVPLLTGMKLAATFTPVPGWRAKKPQLEVVAEYPWPWLIPPHAGSVTSFTAWLRSRS
ncbi:MAG: hypothetical protein RJB01_1119 [Actinomycetota bacterium]|jgi:deoxyribodipyrimidine photo-lyase